MTAGRLAGCMRGEVAISSLTFSTPPDTTSNPHTGIQMQVSWIPGLHVYVQPEAVSLRINLIRLCRAI